MSTWHGIQKEIQQLGVEPIAPGLVELALKLADAVDASPDAPTAMASAAKELRATMTELRKLAPPAVKGDALDDLAARRSQRRGA